MQLLQFAVHANRLFIKNLPTHDPEELKNPIPQELQTVVPVELIPQFPQFD